MKNSLKAIRHWFVGVCRRTAYLLAICTVYPVWFVSLLIFIPLEILFIIIMLFIGWPLFGGIAMEKALDACFKHGDKELWYRDNEPIDNEGKYYSLVPFWASYVHKYYIDRLLDAEED